MSEKSVCNRANALAQKVCDACGCELWDVEYKKEGTGYVLRVFIDKEGGITTDDCEKVSRMMDPMLDEENFIDQSYCFEVSSPGIDRKLIKPEHFRAYLGNNVDIKLFSPVNGTKLFSEVKLVDYKDRILLIEYKEEQIEIELANTAYVRVSFAF
jgi:ribosome maturation factor RimP